MKYRALFLDRDGTLVHSSHYPSRPEQLRLYEGIGSELRLLQRMGLHLILITNQSGIARGYFTESDLQRMHEYLAAELAKQDVYLDGIYYCPHHLDGAIPELAVRCHCRKPQPGMLLQAAADLDLDLEHSWFIGDILDDVEAGNRATCRTILVDLGTEQAPVHPLRCPTFVARNTLHALQIVKTVELLADSLDLVYRPPGWSDYQRQHRGNVPEGVRRGGVLRAELCKAEERQTEMHRAGVPRADAPRTGVPRTDVPRAGASPAPTILRGEHHGAQ